MADRLASPPSSFKPSKRMFVSQLKHCHNIIQFIYKITSHRHFACVLKTFLYGLAILSA